MYGNIDKKGLSGIQLKTIAPVLMMNHLHYFFELTGAGTVHHS